MEIKKAKRIQRYYNWFRLTVIIIVIGTLLLLAQ